MNTRTIITSEPLKLKGGKASVKNVKPKKKDYKLYIRQQFDESGIGFECNIEESEYYNNIIADGNRYFKTRRKSRQTRLLSKRRYNKYFN